MWKTDEHFKNSVNEIAFYIYKLECNIIKMFILFHFIYKFNKIPIKIPASCFVWNSILIFKCSWKGKRPRPPKKHWKKKKEEENTERKLENSDYLIWNLSIKPSP